MMVKNGWPFIKNNLIPTNKKAAFGDGGSFFKDPALIVLLVKSPVFVPGFSFP